MSNIQVPLTGTTKTVLENTITFPCSVSLRSANVGRKIELSYSNGIEYFNPAASLTSATELVLYVNNPANIKVTGAANDLLTITMGRTGK